MIEILIYNGDYLKFMRWVLDWQNLNELAMKICLVEYEKPKLQIARPCYSL